MTDAQALTPEQLDAAISQAVGRELTSNEAFEVCEAAGLHAIVNHDVRWDDPRRFVCNHLGVDYYSSSPVLAIKRAYLKE